MTKKLFRRGRALTFGAALLVSAGALTVGCLERPVVIQTPNTSNVFVEQIVNKAIDKIDLLFVVDNSISMADKQAILEAAVPKMVERLVVPDCVSRDADGNVTGREASTPSATPGGDPSCSTSGFSPEFKPVNDIHIGVITSSLGDHGSNSCDNAAGYNADDKAYLMPKTPTRTGVADPHGTGFLVWKPALDADDPAGTPVQADLDALTADFQAQVVAAGEKGCGFEAPLEAWYRFLVDPSPPADVVKNADGVSGSTGPDQAILDQRAAFLRPDSLVAIVVLTDENDCSAMDGGSYYPYAGYGWLLTDIGGLQANPPNTLPIATPACATNPNDACCFSCLSGSAPAGCDDASQLAACGSDLAPEADRANARCYQNQRRFGIDLLYPVSRYVSGLRDSRIIDAADGTEKENPLFAGGREKSFVFFAGITGVPWQDIATPESLTDDNTLKYLTAQELAEANVPVNGTPVNRWAIILGEPNKSANSIDCGTSSAGCGSAPVAPLDPFMIESIDPRTGTNPIAGIAISTSPTWNEINGHEYNNAAVNPTDGLPSNDDLQYSCIFPLAPYDAVKTGCVPNDTTQACDCGEEATIPKGSPLCKENAGDADTTNAQHWGKAYPATRVLEVLKGFGDNSIVASICPKIHDVEAASGGFNPAVGAIVDRLAEKLGGQCLPRELTVDEDLKVPCTVVEAIDPSRGTLDCNAPGRRAISEANGNEKIEPAVRKQLLANGQCADEAECEQFQICEVMQLVQGTEEGNACLTTPPGGEALLAPGYCYVDPAKGLGDEALVANCDATERRQLRFVGANTPVNNSITFVACTADAVDPNAGNGNGMGGGN